MLDYSKPIPEIEFPSIKEYNIKGLDEEIIDLRGISDRIVISPQYYEKGIPGAPKSCYLRETAAKLLVKAAELLPDGYKIMVFDGWRPYSVQKRLWDYYYREVMHKPENKGLSQEELEFKTSFFVSKPTEDITKPFLHNTGGAVDVTICTAEGKSLNMGTAFDDFTGRAWTNYYEIHDENDEVKKNRRMLYNVMLEAGFTNLPSEWWHYDYGTKFWAYFKSQDALYYGRLTIEGIEQFPLM